MDTERRCETCRYYLGDGCCRMDLEDECAAGGFEAWEGKDIDTMTRLISGYNQGYTQALIDLADYLPALIDDLKLYRVRMTRKRMEEILSLYAAHREGMKQRRGFVRWNTEKKAFEWYSTEEDYGTVVTVPVLRGKRHNR